MRKRLSLFTSAVFFLFGVILFPFAGMSAEWEAGDVTIILPHGTGGGQDRTTRALGQVWAKHLGAKFTYNNKKGASGRVGYDFFINQKKNGSVIQSSNIASASLMYVQQKPKWKWEEEIYPLGIFAVDPGAIFVKADSPFKTLEDLVEAAKKDPQAFSLTFWASPDNMLMHQIMDKTGAKFQVVPTGGASKTVTSVIAGDVSAGYTKVSTILKAGDQTRILAVSLAENPIPDETGNAPTIDAALGIETLGVASYRVINVHREFADNNPEMMKLLKDTLEATKDDPEFIELAKKNKVNPSLIVDMDNEELMAVIQRHWDAHDKFGELMKEK